MSKLERLGYKNPTPIQEQAIPVAIQGKDLVGVAQTGTGKTLAFGIPMIQCLNNTKRQGLIVLPTRELALQVDEALRKVGAEMGLRTAVLIGGASMFLQKQAIARGPWIIIATPGRLMDHLGQRTLRLDTVKIVVLDEADRMLDMGFAPKIKQIFQALPRDRQTMMFSATIPSEIMKMATTYMKLPIRIEVAPSGTTVEKVTQEIFVIPKDSKVRLVEKLLQQYSGSTLIFTRTKFGAKKLNKIIRDMGHTAAELHSNRSLSQRKEALNGFKFGRYRALIATDIASRGIDVTGIELVINFDLPTNAEDYVHRIGRTARAGAGGHAISLVTPDQRVQLRAIERLVRKTLPISRIPDLPPARAYTGPPIRRDEPRRHYQRHPFRRRY
ncbi:MAG: DEAD/DEAH box helicase domain protein [Parcubacteria group bacterium GW2011_GWB1_45_9]|nr:MAG: DEAD/DEAH box helicase domain protein [Parcubacteria group bacterium GW2011_GWB1_45_9]